MKVGIEIHYIKSLQRLDISRNTAVLQLHPCQPEVSHFIILSVIVNGLLIPPPTAQSLSVVSTNKWRSNP